MSYSTRGKHITVDLWGVDPAVLDSVDLIFTMYKAAARAGATVLKSLSYQFEPQGLTAVLLLSESHMSIHTYPEKGFCAIDVYTCGDHVDPLAAIEVMGEALRPTYKQFHTIERGVRWDGQGDQHRQPDETVEGSQIQD
jgi:S-adenosylmethionine decarboxylase